MASRGAQEYVLAWVGAAAGVVGVVLGVLAIAHPEGFPISPGKLLYASASAFVAAAAITGFWRWIRRHMNRSDIEVEKIVTSLEIKDKDAHLARLTRIQVDYANRKVFSHPFRVGGIAAAGEIPEIRIDGAPIPRSEWEFRVNEWSVTKAKQVVLNPGQTISRSFEMDLTDCFPDGTESLNHTVAYEMKELALKVSFSKERQPRRVRAFFAQGTITRDQLEDPVLGQDDFYTTVIPKPKLGAEYRIEWDW